MAIMFGRKRETPEQKIQEGMELMTKGCSMVLQGMKEMVEQGKAHPSFSAKVQADISIWILNIARKARGFLDNPLSWNGRVKDG